MVGTMAWNEQRFATPTSAARFAADRGGNYCTPFILWWPHLDPATGKRMSGMSIESVKSKHEDELMVLPNVVGVGIGQRKGREVIKAKSKLAT